MNIPAIITSQNYGANQTSSQSAEAIRDEKTPQQSNIETHDKVSLSAEGLATQQKDLEAYRMPSWIADYLPEIHDLSYSIAAIEEGRGFVRFSEKLAADGNISAKDRYAINSYLSNSMPVTQHRQEVEIAAQKYSKELEEYGAIHKAIVDKAFSEFGILTQADYQEKVLGVPGDNEDLRLDIAQKLLDNPRALELMEKLGIKRPV